MSQVVILTPRTFNKDHLVFTVPHPSTKRIQDTTNGLDCYLVGIWNAGTKTCTLTQNFSDNIQILSDGITLDGAGHIVTGINKSGVGVLLQGRKNVTVKNINLTNFAVGIYLYYGSENSFSEVTTYGNTTGVYLSNTSGCSIQRSVLHSNVQYGIDLGYSNSNQIRDNVFADNKVAIDLRNSNSNTISGNTVNSGQAGTSASFYLDHSNFNLLINNEAYSAWYGLFIEKISNHNTVKNNTIANHLGPELLVLNFADFNEIYNNNFLNNSMPARVIMRDNELKSGNTNWRELLEPF